MSDRFVKIVAFGLIGEDNQKCPYRQAIFKDSESGATSELFIFKKERPSLWSDIEKMERGGIIPPYHGFITRYNGIELVVLGDESIDESFTKQKWKLNIKGKLSYSEAEKMRCESLGYKTNSTVQNALEIGWRAIDKNVRLIKFRFKDINFQFYWTNWYEIAES
jgi:hypothetical protein